MLQNGWFITPDEIIFKLVNGAPYQVEPDFDNPESLLITALGPGYYDDDLNLIPEDEALADDDEAQDEWNESQHPRVHGGEKGGQFTKGGSGSSSAPESKGERELSSFKSKKDHAEHLLKKGVTTKEMLDALGWPSISMPAMAKSLNMRLEKVKEGKVTRYKGISLGPRAQPEKTHSLLPFLARRGGLRVDDANISDVKTAIGKGNKFIPGFGQLIRTPKKLSTAAREGGAYAPMDLDGAREAAEEAGYIPEGTTLAEFIEAIDSELRGQHVYPAGYLPEGRSADPEQLEHEKNGFMAEFHDKVGELSDSERARAVELWMHEGLNDPLDVLERIALEVDDGEVSAGAPKRSQAVPGWDDDSDAIPF